jgi:uncharacterized ion transporter superfamily protein YfcC
MGHGLAVFVSVVSLAVVVWGIIDVARRPALWIAGMAAGWFLFGIVGAIVAAFYLAGPRRRLKASGYSNRY